jgi:hypothetical protein
LEPDIVDGISAVFSSKKGGGRISGAPRKRLMKIDSKRRVRRQRGWEDG